MEELSNKEEWPEILEEILEEIREEVREEVFRSELLLKFMHGVQFLSRSKGLKELPEKRKKDKKEKKHPERKKRKHSKEVILLQYGIDRVTGRWRSWSGEDDTDEGKLPWDEWATEILGADFCDKLSQAGIHPDDYLRDRVFSLLRERGKF